MQSAGAAQVLSGRNGPSSPFMLFFSPCGSFASFPSESLPATSATRPLYAAGPSYTRRVVDWLNQSPPYPFVYPYNFGQGSDGGNCWCFRSVLRGCLPYQCLHLYQLGPDSLSLRYSLHLESVNTWIESISPLLALDISNPMPTILRSSLSMILDHLLHAAIGGQGILKPR